MKKSFFGLIDFSFTAYSWLAFIWFLLIRTSSLLAMKRNRGDIVCLFENWELILYTKKVKINKTINFINFDSGSLAICPKVSDCDVLCCLSGDCVGFVLCWFDCEVAGILLDFWLVVTFFLGFCFSCWRCFARRFLNHT